MSHSVRSHLRLEIEAYDKMIRAFFPVEDQLAALTDAGFDATCLWRVVPVTVIRAAKPTAPSE